MGKLKNRSTASKLVLTHVPGRIDIFDNLDVSETTRQEYGYRIKLFVSFIKQNGFHRNSYLDFKRYLQKRNDLGIASKNKYLIVAKVYCRELSRQGLLPVDISQGIKVFRQTRGHKREGLSDDEVTAITDYLHQLPPTQKTMRVKAILCLLTLQGLRQCEVIRLNVSDIDFVRGQAQIMGKGRDDKESIDLHPQTCQALKQYLQISRIADGALFTSQSNYRNSQRLTTKSIRNIVNCVFKQLGINKTTHGFRHFFVTRLVKEYKGDLLEVTRYTRHRSLEMLQVYNDNIKRKADLPRYYETFNNIGF